MADTYVHRGYHSKIAASETLTFTGQPADDDTVTIDGKVYRFKTVLSDTDGYVLIGGSLADTIINLRSAINLDAGAGSLYAASTTLHPTVSAAAFATTMLAAAKTPGLVGNGIPLLASGANHSWDSAALNGGLDEGYVYWTSTAWDPTGTDYAGYPPFGTLTGIVVSLFIPDVGGGGGGTAATEDFEISGPLDDEHTLANTPLPGTLILFLNGVRLRAGAGNDYTISGADITLLVAVDIGYILGASYEF